LLIRPRLREGMEEMPQDSPPRTMIEYVETAKANTDFLALLRKESPERDDIETITCGRTKLGLSARFATTEKC
jgi:hypothetical protein